MSIDILAVDTDEALVFWEDSPHASSFTHPLVLSKLAHKVDWWMAKKGHRPLCLWPISINEDRSMILPDLTYYVGPMWSKASANMPVHRWLSRSSEVYEGFISQFLVNYGTIQACLPKGLLDVRIFDWWNYHQPEKPKFIIRPRYTACIYDLDNKSKEEIVSDYRQLRRRELRKIEKFGVPPRAHQCAADDLIKLYADVMGLLEGEIGTQKTKLIHQLINLVHDGFGEVIAFEDTVPGQIAAACLILFDQYQANMILNLVATDWKNTGLPALMITESIFSAKSHGLNCFDFNGANSPLRGDDKHSYGAIPDLFFDISYPG